MESPSSSRPQCAVLAPLLFLTVTVELEDEADRVHLHPGGQGFWIARMATVLGCGARLVAPIGGEAGDVLASLLPAWDVELLALRASITSPTQVHDRRSGERIEIVRVEVPTLDRHDADDLYGMALEAALTSDAVVLTAVPNGPLTDDSYQRLVHDLNAQDIPVFADLHGETLDAVLEAGRIDVLKVSHEDLNGDGWDISDEGQAIEAARELAARGAGMVILSRGAEPAIAAMEKKVLRVITPALEEVDHRGAGDSMTAGLAAGRLLGMEPMRAVALGAAAGAGNVTRHGLGSGRPELITELAARVELEDIA